MNEIAIPGKRQFNLVMQMMHINCVFVISQDILTDLDRAIISDVIVIDFQYYVILLKDAICRGAFKNFDHQHAIFVSIKAIGCFRRRAVQSLCAKAQIRKSIERSVFGSPTYFIDGDMFYGQDRLEMVERALRQPYKPSNLA